MGRKLTYLKLLMILITPVFAYLQYSCTINSESEDHFDNPPHSNNDLVMSLIGENNNYSLFYNKLKELGFDDLLSRNQYFTVFVPVNSAFDGIPEYTADEWKKIIGFHIVYASLYSIDFGDLRLRTFNGKYMNMRSVDPEYLIDDSRINMEQVDNYCQNGVVHEIDKLLIPKPNLYEYILSLDSDYSILKDFLVSMDRRFVDYEKSIRIGVNDNGDPVYDTIWKTENYYLDHIAALNDENEAYTAFIPSNDDVNEALNSIATYFGNIGEMDDETYQQLLFIAFSGSFMEQAVTQEDLPDTIISVTGKSLARSNLDFKNTNLEMSNGIVHLLNGMTIPKNFYLTPIVIECDQKENRKVSNTIYATEQLSDSRASLGSYFYYGCRFVGDYLEFSVHMVYKTTYWFTWTGPKQGPSHYQVFVKDDITGEFVNIGPPVNNWTKVAWQPVVSGTYTFNEFGTKTVRFVIVDELPVVGFNAIYVDYIKLTPAEIYEP